MKPLLEVETVKFGARVTRLEPKPRAHDPKRALEAACMIIGGQIMRDPRFYRREEGLAADAVTMVTEHIVEAVSKSEAERMVAESYLAGVLAMAEIILEKLPLNLAGKEQLGRLIEAARAFPARPQN